MSCNGVTQCWPAQRGQAIVPRSSPYMVRGKWIQARTQYLHSSYFCHVFLLVIATTV